MIELTRFRARKLHTIKDTVTQVLVVGKTPAEILESMEKDGAQIFEDLVRYILESDGSRQLWETAEAMGADLTMGQMEDLARAHVALALPSPEVVAAFRNGARSAEGIPDAPDGEDVRSAAAGIAARG